MRRKKLIELIQKLTIVGLSVILGQLLVEWICKIK